ncbi:MAG TPA: MoxR family ATPase [Bacillota bacterium]|jgi:MoxR-like ATPase
MASETAAEMAARFIEMVRAVESEVGRVMVGQEAVIRQVLITILAGGHALLEGVPGLGKTVLVRTFGQALALKFSRIQFTPDLMPADIVGTNVIAEDAAGARRFEFQPGPIFANLVLADEINRATPKTQSAMLESMQEKQVTVGTSTRTLPKPFFVLATQNPIEMEGTYPLPEAQLDRFFFKVLVGFPKAGELSEIIRRTTTGYEAEVRQIASGEDLLGLTRMARDVPIADPVADYAVRLLLATHPKDSPSAKAAQFVRYGASPRGLQTLVLAAKIRALLEGRFNVADEDLREVAPPALRHRFFLNFEGEAEGLTTDDVISDLLTAVPTSAG